MSPLTPLSLTADNRRKGIIVLSTLSMRTLRVGLAQINTTVGDLEGNVAKVLEYARRAAGLGCDVVAFPELAVTGYPPEDLLLRRSFIVDNLEALQRIVEASAGLGAPTLVVGFVDDNGDIYNAAAVVHGGWLAGVYHKRLLPNYGVFDENRHFQAGTEAPVFEIAGVRVGVNVCEDIWYPNGPHREQALAGAEVIVNINGSPFHAGKRRFREEMRATRASGDAGIVCYVNLVGGQDELVFDGGSGIFDERAELIARAAQFEEELLVCDLDVDAVHQTRLHDPRRRKEKLDVATGDPASQEAEAARAACPHVVVVDALGAGHVIGVAMPSRYSSEGSLADAQLVAESLGIQLQIIPIEPAHAAYLEMLA